MTTRKQPDQKKRRQPARAPVASSEPVSEPVARASVAPALLDQPVAIPVVRETHDSAVVKPGLIPR